LNFNLKNGTINAEHHIKMLKHFLKISFQEKRAIKLRKCATAA